MAGVKLMNVKLSIENHDEIIEAIEKVEKACRDLRWDLGQIPKPMVKVEIEQNK